MINFKFRKKSGIIRESAKSDDLPESGIFLDVPDYGVVALLDDIKQVIISDQAGLSLHNYQVEPYPESHHMS